MKCLFNVFFLYHIVTGKIIKSNQTLINSVILKHYNLTEPHYPLPFLSVWECVEILNYAHWGAFVHAFFITKGDNTKIFLSKHAKMFDKSSFINFLYRTQNDIFWPICGLVRLKKNEAGQLWKLFVSEKTKCFK